MKFILLLFIPISFLFNHVANDKECIRYYRFSNVKKRIGYNHIKDIIELCPKDSTFKQTVYYHRKSLTKTRIIRTEETFGQWHSNKNSLTLILAPELYGDSITHEYYKGNTRLVYLTIDGKRKGRLVKTKYKWRVMKEGRNLIKS